MTDGDLRAYLLGHLPAADAVRLEEKALDDQVLFDALRSVEDDLFDDYAHHRMSGGDRERFLARYADQAARLSFAHALASHSPLTPAVAGAGAGTTPSRRWIWLPAAAAIALAAGTLLQRPAVAPDPPLIAAGPPAPAGPVTIVALTLGGSRAAGGHTTITVPGIARAIAPHVRLDPAERFDRYAVEIRSSTDAVVWSGRELRASIEGNEPVLIAEIPATAMPDGTYEIAVRGAADGELYEDVGFVTLTVHRER